MVLAGLAHIVPPTRSPRRPTRAGRAGRAIWPSWSTRPMPITPVVTDRGTAFMSSVVTSNGAELRAKRTVVAPNLS